MIFFKCRVLFFVYYKSNTISLEVYGNKTHYHMYIKLSSVSFCFPRAFCRYGVRGGPEIEIIEGVWRGVKLKKERRRGRKKTNFLDKRISEEIF